MNKTVTIGAAIVLGLIGLMLWGRSNQVVEVPENPGAVSALSASKNLHDFGTISMKNGEVSNIFKVTNSSDKDIYVKKISTSCMCTKVYIEGGIAKKGPFGMEGHGFLPPANEVIKVGESRDIKVVFDPNAHGPAGVGAIDRLVYLTDESGQTFHLEIKAVVTP